MAHLCPKCDSRGRVKDVRRLTQRISSRRYSCTGCAHRWSTVELFVEEGQHALAFLDKLAAAAAILMKQFDQQREI